MGAKLNVPLLIAILVLVLALLGGVIVLSMQPQSPIQTIKPSATATPIPTVPLKEEYSNPFDEKNQYSNPFEETTSNPFDALEQ